ncbi:MAG: FlgD immunoglobulin-like domain containing protein [Candidatus Krumholzibacteriaceae bacterium]|jgi:hypothetical protein
MKNVMKTVPLIVLGILIIAAPCARAYWVQDGAALCTATGDQTWPEVTSDGAGGAIVTWTDQRGGDYYVYAQRVNALGTVLWTTDGVAICLATAAQYPTIVSDGSGGAIVTWFDRRSGNYDIYAQRVNASGTVQWTANGVALCTATGDQEIPQMISDGSSGAVVTWEDYRNGNNDIYAQRVNASGVVQWAANGVALCTATGDQTRPTIVSDGAAGAVITWEDRRNGNYDVYAQRVNASGVVQWAVNGVAISTATGDQMTPAIISDGAAGAIITWVDSRPVSNYDIYAQRVNASGAVQWAANGVAVCALAGDQNNPTIIADGVGGAIVTWWDTRSVNYGIYAQRLNASGVAQWTANGVGLSTGTGGRYSPVIVSDGGGGAIVTWIDERNGHSSPEIYAQRVSASGSVQWTANGVRMGAAAGIFQSPQIISDGAAGAIVTWSDNRSGNYDIYAQSIDSKGGLLAPVIYAVRDVPGDQGGKVYLSWYAARYDVFMNAQMSHYSIWRAIDATKAALALEKGASSLDDLSKLDLSAGKNVIRMERASGRTFFWQLITTVDARYLPAYGKTMATLFDSTAICTDYTYFQVVAHTTTPTLFWASAPDSGYSVDNIAPGTPKALTGKQSYTPVGLDLTWDHNTEADLGHYAVYRGTSAGFVPGPSNLVASPTDTSSFDAAWRWSGGYYYKVSAIDIHGNESGFALLTPDAVTGVETPKAPAASYLAQNYPNPFNPMTRIAFGLSAPGHVSLRIYDAAGRLVRMLAEGNRPAANFAEVWDGKDARGAPVASGIYFCRLDAGSFTQTRKMILLR